MNKVGKNLTDLLMITVGTAFVAAAVFFFMMPSGLAVGSISGLAIVLGNFIPLPVSAITMILNIVLLILGFIFIGKEFGGKTVYTSVLMPLLLRLFERLFPNNRSLMGDPFVDMVCYLFAVSLGLAILFNRNASSGGLDIVAKFLNKYFHMELGSAMSLAGMAAALSSALVSDARIVILSILGTYLNGIVLDRFIFGFDQKKRVCIISRKVEQIRKFLVWDLHSGASVYQVSGALNMEPRQEIIAIVDRNEYLKLMKFVEKTDPDAFITVYDVNKIIYRPKQKEIPQE